MHRVFAAVPLLVAIASCSQQRDSANLPLDRTAIPANREFAVDFELADVAVSNGGQILALADRTDDRVLVRSWDATSSRQIGRKGDGPCEFRNLVSVAWLNDSIVAVSDGHTGQVRLCREGVPTGPTILVPGEIYRLQAGDGFESVLTFGQAGIDSILVLRLTSTGVYPAVRNDTVRAISNGALDSLLGGNNRRSAMVADTGGRVFFGTNDTTFKIARATKESVATFFIGDASPAQFSVAELDALDAEIRRFLARTGRPSPPITEASKALARTPRSKPRFKGRSLAVDSVGRVWALPSYPDSLPAGLIAYSASGKLLTTIQVSGPLSGFLIAGSKLVGFWNDADGRGHVAEWVIGGTTELPTLH